MKNKLMIAVVLMLSVPSMAFAHPGAIVITNPGTHLAKLPMFHHFHHGIGKYSKTVFGTGSLLGYSIMGGLLLALIIDKAPSWNDAKNNNSEAAYQSQEMFPQQLFDKLPGGTPGRKNVQVVPVKTASVGGYWEGLMLASK